ncbi:hypothetical protein HDU88_005978 [Geranomyces variabilis]|nr:hypothetical protein HDU88_005978 [Geranomyces variabilis]
MSSPPLTRWGSVDEPAQSPHPTVNRLPAILRAPSNARGAGPATESNNPAAVVVNDEDQPLTRWVTSDTEDATPPPTPYLYNDTIGTALGGPAMPEYEPSIPILDDTHDPNLAAMGDPDDEPHYVPEDYGQEWYDGELVGWDDTVFLPLGIQLDLLGDDLVQIATDDEVQIDYHRKDNTLRIRADTQERLAEARNKIDSMLLNFELTPRSAPLRTIPKAPKPGSWGQPRSDCTRLGVYNVLG